MKTRLLLALLLLLTARTSEAGLSPNPISISVMQGGAFHPHVGISLAVVLRTRTSYAPAFRLGETRIVGRDVEIEVLLPNSTETVEPYDAVLMTRFVPTEAGIWNIKVFSRRNEQRLLETTATFHITNGFVRLTYRGPQQPVEDDDIVVELDRMPSLPLQIDKADSQIRLKIPNSTQWQPAPEGYRVSLGKLSAGDYRIQLFSELGGAEAEVGIQVAPTPAVPGPLVLAEDFEVAVTWENTAGERGEAKLVQPPSRDSALLYFFSPANWELMIKVLDGCAINGHYWVFGAASTDMGYTVDILQRSTGATFRAQNRVGVAAPAITEIRAFPCS